MRARTHRLEIAIKACTITVLTFVAALLPLALSSSANAQSGASDWETAAGGKMSFEVASVKPNASQRDFWLNIAQEPDDGQDVTPSGGLFDARDWPLWMYMAFAYKLPFDQAQILRSDAPKWVVDDNFDIQGRATGNPSKDQYRLMVQALLADRFKMAVAWQTRQGPVDVLELAKLGQLGPQLRPFPDGFPCATSAPKAGRGGRAISEDVPGTSNNTVPGGFPAYCGAFVPLASSTPGNRRSGARNVSWEQIERRFALIGGQIRAFDRPVVDKTGITGNYDVTLEFGAPRGDRIALDESFLDALKDQLGIEAKAATGPVQVLVITHVEQPAAN